ncbi:NAD(P)-dependent oxidoreductase [Rhodobacteraceae bacterium N5(2021)]|uniref:NAD(P)-dependent oxidoreductase n=1 Tax=Gymnodinialimonas phycosphaerae TaxID=2841589 RepID=A0A975YGS8_9RHOB|nr:NAD(P)-dependent oxidoreductase [Gymnodinialimonas phycosphaerae]MBY4891965.1 NAD(P)-dependent oxidoreductase [Gymnodinialimonas phycosphaerae]
MRVGFAGLGRMGREMAANLASAGYDMVLWNRSRDRAQDAARDVGARIAATPRELAETTEIVVTMLADDPASAQVHFGADGLFAATGARLFVEMGTMSPDHIADLNARAPEGAVVIDAPVSGATQAARDAQLLIMAGCDAATGADVRPLFDAMGRNTVYLGRPGAGAVMKLGVNMLIHGLNQTLAEALALTQAAGIPREAAFGVIEQSAAAAPMLSYRKPLYLDDMSGDVSFTVALAQKDMAVTCALARQLGVEIPQSQITRALLDDAAAAGFADRDMAAIVAYMQEKTK